MECWAEFMVVPSSGRAVPISGALFRLIHSLRSRKWLGFILRASPPRPSISPPRGSISPPGSESSRSFSITIKRPSGSENAAEVFVRTFCGSDSRYNARIVEVDSRVL
ncbi:uncharacterized protein LOC109727029 isoform X1 [Ananas comosus]|uniref:Uncharacterized protein LOC109727029 isoform X1 n=1 Tax=Ananas comosus TaxID=4615 RepID=A0A6P5H4K5_ANACO|nr:uncharacterized protein LOC109727029 isoform X1 [Ananas comosus]